MIVHPYGQFDNSARDYAHIEAKPLAAAMGAEIAGAELANLSDAAFEEVRDALFRHKMIFFRGQKISHGEHEAFSARFGAFAEDAYTQGVPGHRDVHPLIKEADAVTGHIFGSGWHTDSPFMPEPPAITCLRSIEIPPYGGDTMWANSALAYKMLSDTMKALLEPLRVHMSMRNVFVSAQAHAKADDGPVGRLSALKGADIPEDVARKIEGTCHPLVRTHPVSGEKALYFDPSYAIGFEGLSEDEAQPILDFLGRHLTQPAFTCRLRWEPDMLAMWDNRLCIHQAFNDYDGFRRELYRTTIAGEKPA
ncbi:TauD/TfdA dioxygenase family protein [Parasphingopyxis marina]|uniref:TauD/TfdA family dioxygenase n=1 Tax=Parasphingopyxis marina TaxID=2761622 RepID=A0A842HUP2_9SPHN|nr:TauD/TfdA family dioxygenase [Parasphingopyxis marina]MBC2776786.1 TauD/TfdA family dioxygenase [Parasphingopyxis marina]